MLDSGTEPKKLYGQGQSGAGFIVITQYVYNVSNIYIVIIQNVSACLIVLIAIFSHFFTSPTHIKIKNNNNKK